MNRNPRTIILIAIALLLCVLAGAIISCGATPAPTIGAFDAEPSGITHRNGFYADNDMEAGDDLIAGDDATIGDDLTAGGDLIANTATTTASLTVGNSLTVTTGTVSFPAASISLSALHAGLHGFGANVHTVCSSGCDYTSVSSAVAAASAGDTIIVAPGSYSNEQITIAKNLNIIGETNATLAGVAQNSVITVTTGTVYLENLTLNGGDEKEALNIDGGTVTLRRITATGGQPSDVLYESGAGAKIDAGTVYTYDSSFTGPNSIQDMYGGSGLVLSIGTGTLHIYNSTITGGSRPTVGEGAGRGLYVGSGATAHVHSCSITGGSATDSGEAADGIGAYGTVRIFNSTISAGAGTGSATAANAIAAAGGTLQVFDSLIIGPAGAATTGYGIKATNSGTYHFHSCVVQADQAVYAFSTGKLSIYHSRLESTVANNPVADIPANNRLLDIFHSNLVATGSPAAAITCASGTTLSVALLATNVPAMTEAVDCTNDIGTPYNVEDAQID